MYKKILGVLFISMIFIFGFSKTAFSDDRALGLDDNSYFLEINYKGTIEIYTFSSFLNNGNDDVNMYNVNVYDETGKLKTTFDKIWFNDGVVVDSTGMKSNNMDVVKYISSINSDVSFTDDSGTIVPPPLWTLMDLMRDLFQGLLTDLKTLLPICLGIFSLMLGFSLIKRIIFSHLS